jgi:putative SOS response-associated peptidase YedK
MCNLYRLTSNVEAIRRLFGVVEGGFLNLPALPEIYPGQSAPVVRASAQGRRLEAVAWGFPPPPAAGARPVTNVRNLASPFWRTALSRPDQRCLVPADAFAEWEGTTGAKRKRWFDVDGGRPFAFAGVWRPTEEGAAMAFLTCEPNTLVAAVHPKAMPVILDAAHHEAWLSAPFEAACTLAAPFPAGRMRMLD